MSLLEEFKETHNSDNRHHSLCIDEEDEIIVGGSCTHVFILPFKYSNYVVNSKIMYKQGLFTVLEKYPSEYKLEEKSNGTTVLSLRLSPEDTKKFNRPILKTYVQMKIETANNETLYNKLNKIKVIVPVSDLREPN